MKGWFFAPARLAVDSGAMTDPDFVARRTTDVTLRDGARVRIRPITPEDKDAIHDGFRRLSPDSRYRRFFTDPGDLTPKTLAYLTEVDYVDHFAWVAFSLDEEGNPGVGVARYVRFAGEPDVADAAVTVVDDYQGRGLGSILLEALALVALEKGITHFRSYVLRDNRPMLDLLHTIGAELTHDSPGVLKMDLSLPERVDKLTQTSLYEALRAAARGELPVVPRGPASGRPASGEPGP